MGNAATAELRDLETLNADLLSETAAAGTHALFEIPLTGITQKRFQGRGMILLHDILPYRGYERFALHRRDEEYVARRGAHGNTTRYNPMKQKAWHHRGS